MATSHLLTCSLCEAMCGLAIEAEDGHVRSIRGDVDDVFSRGHICPKAVALQDLHEDPDRLRRPMRRRGSSWEEVGWDDALDEVAQRLADVQGRHGRHAVAVYQGNPIAHNYGALLGGQFLVRALRTRSRFSATSVDQLPHMLASLLMFGHQLRLPVPDVDRTQHFLMLGANPAGRPWPALRSRLVVALGAVLAVMNACFYIAIDRLPLGTVAAIEFLPVILLAALGVRSLRNLAALVVAVAGVYALVDVRLEGEPVGVAFAFANAALFAAYIVLAHRVARTSAIDGLAAAMLVAVVVATPIGLASAAPALVDPVALLAGIGVGLASSVIPYVFDQLAMARLSRAGYSLMVSLLPATATVVGLLVLAQVPTAPEIAGVALVVAAMALRREQETPARVE